jgi:hypothetical protein
MSGFKYNNSRAYVSKAPGSYYAIAATDFGVPAPSSASLVYNSATGSLVTGTAAVAVTWITQEGVSLAGVSATVSVQRGASQVLVTQPSPVPTGQQPVVGWQIYSANSSGTPSAASLLLNEAAGSTVPSPTNVVSLKGISGAINAVISEASTQNILGYTLGVTLVALRVAGTGSGVPRFDTSGIQPALPTIPANGTVDYYATIPNTGSQWHQGKSVEYMNSEGIPETEGIVLNHLDCIWLPNYPGAVPPPVNGEGGQYQQASVAPGTLMSLNQTTFEAVQASSASTALVFIGGDAFNYSRGSQTTDGGVTWLSLGGPMVQVRFAFSNLTSGSSLTPASRIYELFQD